MNLVWVFAFVGLLKQLVQLHEEPLYALFLLRWWPLGHFVFVQSVHHLGDKNKCFRLENVDCVRDNATAICMRRLSCAVKEVGEVVEEVRR